MNKMLVGILAVVVVAVVGVVILRQPSEKTDKAMMEKKEEVVVQKDEKKPEEGAKDAMMAKSGKYVQYSKSNLDAATEGRRVLFFYASWCPTCKPTDADLIANTAKLPADLTVVRVNYNDPDTDAEEKELAKKYAVTYQHTFVQVDKDGNVVTKWNGGATSELLTKIK